jgi:hypothetical protein
VRKLLLLASLIVCALLVYLLRHEAAPPPRAPSHRGLLEGESLRDLPDLPEEKIPKRDETVLTGHVYGPDGSPVEKAEVRIVYPRTFDLVRTGPDGDYEMPFEHCGQFLLEAALTIELAPQRRWVNIPDRGAVPPIDFRLEPAGAIFGDVTLAGVPVADAGVELYATDVLGDETLFLDTSARNGYFNFYFYEDLPKDVPLRLDVKSTEGILRTPLRFVWKGKQRNAGKLDLTPYPSLRIHLRLPDGRIAPDVDTCRFEDLQPAEVWRGEDVSGPFELAPTRILGSGSRVAIPEEKDVTADLVFLAEVPWRPNPAGTPVRYLVRREVALTFGQPKEIDLVVRPGPFVVTSRLVDDRGRAVHARLALKDREVETRADGSFQLPVPWGGLHAVRVAALDAPGVGWVDLAPDEVPHYVVLDADDPAACVLDLGARVLAVLTVPSQIRLENTPWGFLPIRPVGGAVACLSPKLAPGDIRWTLTTGQADGHGDVLWDESPRSGTVTVEEGALAVLDPR